LTIYDLRLTRKETRLDRTGDCSNLKRALMKITRLTFACAGLLFLWSCATTPEPSANAPAIELPADVAMNKEAGRGGHLIVSLRLEGGEELPLGVDTGTAITLLPKSLEPRLGKRLGTETFEDFGVKHKIGIYAAPKLFLGNTLLVTGSRIGTWDDAIGILGMDCLRHYCIQLDFQARTLRFLDSEHLNVAELGRAFPLTGSGYAYIHHNGLFQEKSAELLVDTGHPLDGMVESGLFQRQVLEQQTDPIALLKDGVVNDAVPDLARFPNCVWDGDTYTNLTIGKGRPNLIGLGFLARHLVTLDFPKRIMYLKQTSIGPLVDEDLEAALQCLRDLKEKGQLPGWPRSEKGTMRLEIPPDSEIFQFAARRPGDSSLYHYQVTRTSEDSPWKLEKAWQTDANDRLVKVYPVPQESHPR
jgi:hypothetical protein